MTEASAGDGRGHPGRPTREQITTRIVQLHKECFGKGPTKARAYWEANVITVVTSNGLTADERTLRDAGRAEAVVEHRTQLNEAVRERFRRELEELTGRRVAGYVSGIQVHPSEMAVDVFVLEPEEPVESEP